MRIRVLTATVQPVPDALIELWQADADGRYVAARGCAGAAAAGFSGFGRLPTDADGRCVLRNDSIRAASPIEQGRMQASHINVCLFARGLLRQLYTRVYFAGDDGLDWTRSFRWSPRPAVRRSSARRATTDAWRFDLRLQGANETVFFDL